MVELSHGTIMEVDEKSLKQEEYNKVEFPNQDESFVIFLHMCEKKISEVILGPRCSSLFDRKVVENTKGVRRASDMRN